MSDSHSEPPRPEAYRPLRGIRVVDMADEKAELAGPRLIQLAREWIADVQWADEFDPGELTAGQVYGGIERYYDGGWAQFARDSQ